MKSVQSVVTSPPPNIRWNPCDPWSTTAAAIFLLSLASAPIAGAAPTEDAGLALPPRLYATVGTETGFRLENVILSENPNAYRLEATCTIGRTDGRRWSVTPGAADVGEHPLRVEARDPQGHPVGCVETRLVVSPRDSGAERRLTLLIVGDSLTAASVYPNTLARLLSEPGNPEWRMLGTSAAGGRAPGVFHEGYGGWAWKTFLTRQVLKPGALYRDRSSPFLFPAADNDTAPPPVDLKRYIAERCNGAAPDLVTFLLGINDCFSFKADNPAEADRKISEVFSSADSLLAAFRKALPAASLAVCTAPPPNAREAAFVANYKGKHDRWNWKRIQHRLVRKQIEHFGGRESDRIFLVPVGFDLDPMAGYPETNAVHPNTAGYGRIAADLYAWMKCWLAR